ncbi:MAG: putative DNA modification/repair radical SAM protein [Clostridiales bacterium]|nr:putative DNA modification/repair radical SAM protein [Clostridiales bacterium]
MDLMEKLTLLADSAKYDVACTSSGVDRPGGKGLGNAVAAGICHSFAADGRCISLLKVLLSNQCIYNCRYCVNRVSNDVPRAAFTPQELAEITLQFYRRNYIEGLFLSSGVLGSPDHTMELMIRALEILRHQHQFNGYIHAKAIPGASPALVEKLGLLADRMSINIELPSEDSLMRLAPNKTKEAILSPMDQVAKGMVENQRALTLYRHAPRFVPAGQSTQMIIGASPETDYQILRLASSLYRKYSLKRVFFSAYIPTASDTLLPALDTKPPLLREHRLYQADFLMRQYQFQAEEILSKDTPNFNPFLDPKCNWAVNHMDFFPVDVNKAPLEVLLRVPGIGPISARRIITARRSCALTLEGLKRLGVVLKRAQYFITVRGSTGLSPMGRERVVRALVDPKAIQFGMEQLSLFSPAPSIPAIEAGTPLEQALEEAVSCLVSNL